MMDLSHMMHHLSNNTTMNTTTTSKRIRRRQRLLYDRTDSVINGVAMKRKRVSGVDLVVLAVVSLLILSSPPSTPSSSTSSRKRIQTESSAPIFVFVQAFSTFSSNHQSRTPPSPFSSHPRRKIHRDLQGMHLSTTSSSLLSPLLRPLLPQKQSSTISLSSSSLNSDTANEYENDDRNSNRSIFARIISLSKRLPPFIQLFVAMSLYMFHTIVLTQISIPFPFQLIPNERGHFQSIGADSLLGIATLVTYQYCRHRQQQHKQQHNQEPGQRPSRSLRSLFRAPSSEDELPWKGVCSSKYAGWTSFGAFWILLAVWRQIGNWNITIEDILYELAAGENALLPITVPMHRSLSVLLGHVSWIFAASLILRFIPRPQPFFQQKQPRRQQHRESKDTPQSSSSRTDFDATVASTNATNHNLIYSTQDKTLPPSTSKWFRSNYRDTNWLWWSIGGYFVSSWLFKISDYINAYILPTKFLEMAASSSVVSQLINPEGQDWLASFVGFIAPCVTAPWFEEVLYRGFLLPALTTWIPILFPKTIVEESSPSETTDDCSSLKLEWTYYWSIFWSGVLFSIHHVNLTSFIPLCVLGWTWAVIYAKSMNLWTTVVIHAMWNSRIFLASWL